MARLFFLAFGATLAARLLLSGAVVALYAAFPSLFPSSESSP